MLLRPNNSLLFALSIIILKGCCGQTPGANFVANVIKNANETLDQTAKFDISLDELISRVCAKREIKVKDLVSKSRKRYLSQARGVLCYLAVDALGYSGNDVARSLRISGRGVSDSSPINLLIFSF